MKLTNRTKAKAMQQLSKTLSGG